MDKEEIISLIKRDLEVVSDEGMSEELGYKVLDDGNLVVQEYHKDGHVLRTYLVKLSIGRELSPAEWQEP